MQRHNWPNHHVPDEAAAEKDPQKGVQPFMTNETINMFPANSARKRVATNSLLPEKCTKESDIQHLDAVEVHRYSNVCSPR